MTSSLPCNNIQAYVCAREKAAREKENTGQTGQHMLSRFRGISDDVRQTKKEKKK
jgi:hypothetical protein